MLQPLSWLIITICSSFVESLAGSFYVLFTFGGTCYLMWETLFMVYIAAIDIAKLECVLLVNNSVMK